MVRLGRWVLGTVIAAGGVTGALVGAANSAQAQGILGSSGPYTPTGQALPVGPVNVAQFPALGVDPPYNPATIGVPQSMDITVLRGRADATSPQVGQFPMAFMGPVPVR